ncbi:MAG TPA: hypothetical protein VG096_03445 [Bryobacteraceae bacterium]|jgi:hypothetical protein|nr:hypothetical protein [Bryobacteraceae bacterium]
MAAVAASPILVPQRQQGWIYKPSWDLPLLIFSAVLVPLPFLVAWIAQTSGLMNPQQAINLINITVAALIGGPHLFSTVTYTFLDGGFRARHPRYAALAFLLPVLVVYFGVKQYTLLITFFFTWASLHVLHQIIYLTDCYRTRNGQPEPSWSRFVDYGLILSGMYPIGLYKLSLREFQVGGVVLPYPDWVRPLHLPILAGVVFAIFLVAWIGKTAIEFREQRCSLPKTLLIGITTVVSFCLPMGSNLDVLFQGYNTWHSFQYLFLLWLLNRLRDERGEIESGVVRHLVRRNSMIAYYVCFLAATGVLVLLTLVVRAVTPLAADQSYFVVVLSVLLMHYYFDHFLFSQPKLVA